MHMLAYREESGINNKKKNAMCACKPIAGYHAKEIEAGLPKSHPKTEQGNGNERVCTSALSSHNASSSSVRILGSHLVSVKPPSSAYCPQESPFPFLPETSSLSRSP